LEGSHAFQEVQSPLSYRPRSSLPVEVLRWLAERLAHLCPVRCGGQGGTPPVPLEVRLDDLGAVVLDGLSYRRAARMVGILIAPHQHAENPRSKLPPQVSTPASAVTC
jgi:hypothetical protein